MTSSPFVIERGKSYEVIAGGVTLIDVHAQHDLAESRSTRLDIGDVITCVTALIVHPEVVYRFRLRDVTGELNIEGGLALETVLRPVDGKIG